VILMRRSSDLDSDRQANRVALTVEGGLLEPVTGRRPIR
jgi:hypothetical protein